MGTPMIHRLSVGADLLIYCVYLCSLSFSPPVGNIPYDATEEQLRELFSQAGPVVSFRYRCMLYLTKM